MIRLAVLNAATSPQRLGDRITDWIVEVLGANRAFDIDRIDLRDLDLPLFDEPELPRYGRYLHEHTRRWSRRIAAADSFVIVSPEYNRGYSALLKNSLDYLAQEWAFKPVGIVSYGSGLSGGLRGADALRTVLGALQMFPVREMVVVPGVTRSAIDDGTVRATDGMLDGAERMIDALVRMDAAMYLMRSPGEEIGDQQGEADGFEVAARQTAGEPDEPWHRHPEMRPRGFS